MSILACNLARRFFQDTQLSYSQYGASFKAKKKCSITSSMQKLFNQSAQFIKSIMRCTWFKSPTIFKTSPNFDHTHPVILTATFSFHKFVSACKKFSPIHCFILKIQQILESWDLQDHAHFYLNHPKIIKGTFGIPEFLSTHQKPVYSINSLLRYSQF